MLMDMDMDQVWSIFFINFFSALEGVEIAFFVSFFFLWAGGEGIENGGWTCTLFFFSYPDECCCWYAWLEGEGGKGREGRDLQV